VAPLEPPDVAEADWDAAEVVAAAEEAADDAARDDEVALALPLAPPEVAEPEAETDCPVTPADPAALVAVELRHESEDPAWMVKGDEY